MTSRERRYHGRRQYAKNLWKELTGNSELVPNNANFYFYGSGSGAIDNKPGAPVTFTLTKENYYR